MPRISTERLARLERALTAATAPPPAFARIEGEPVPPNLMRWHLLLPGKAADAEAWERECEALKHRR